MQTRRFCSTVRWIICCSSARQSLAAGGSLRLRLALAAALFGGLYAAAALFAAAGRFAGDCPMKLASLAAMLLIAFGAGRQTLRTGASVSGGSLRVRRRAAVSAAQLFGTGVLVLPGGTFYAVSVLGLLLLAGLLYMLCYTVFACTAQHGGEIRTHDSCCMERTQRAGPCAARHRLHAPRPHDRRARARRGGGRAAGASAGCGHHARRRLQTRRRCCCA